MKKIIALLLLIFILGIGFGVYYLANGCYCYTQERLCDSEAIDSIKYSNQNKQRTIVDRDSIRLIAEILNQSVQLGNHGKISKNEYTDDVFRLKIFSKEDDLILLEIFRLDSLGYYMYYKRNSNFFKQCVYGNDKLSTLVW